MAPNKLLVAFSFTLCILNYSYADDECVGVPCKGVKVANSTTEVGNCKPNGDSGEWCLTCIAECKFSAGSSKCENGALVNCPVGVDLNVVDRCFSSQKVCEKAKKDANGLCPSDGGQQKICDKCISCPSLSSVEPLTDF